MRALLLALLLLALAPALVRAASLEGLGADAARARQALGGHVLRTPDGDRLPLASLRGEVVVVNFWASWCAPCRRELPALDALNTEIAARGARILAVSIDTDPRNAKRFARSIDLRLPVYADGPDGLAKSLDLGAVPLTLVLDRTGDIVYASTHSDEAAIRRLREVVQQHVTTKAIVSRTTEGDTR
jgi:thiol-disulfide isomerase/thioredoxin